MQIDSVRVSKALLSLTDKSQLEKLCAHLVNFGCELYATQSTAKAIEALGHKVVAVESTTGFPEILGGRVKTLHPKIFGGILAQTHLESDRVDLETHKLPVFDLVVCNLYPFEATLQKVKETKEHLTTGDLSLLVEKIDIGGVSLLRAAAKNFARVAVLSDPNQYDLFTKDLEANKGSSSAKLRSQLAIEAFALTAKYDLLIHDALSEASGQTLSLGVAQNFNFHLTKQQNLRYGENPHQKAFFAAFDAGTNPLRQSNIHSKTCNLAERVVLQGKELSYNNVLDVEHAIRLANEFSEPAAVIVKHNVACGVATSPKGLHDAYLQAFACDKVSPFGGIVVLNREVQLDLAQLMSETFLEVVVAPKFDEDAKIFLSKKKNLRLVELPVTAPLENAWSGVFVQGGILFQESDKETWHEEDFKMVTQCPLPPNSSGLIRFAYTAVKHLRSNAIAIAVNSASGGFQSVALVGGLTNRVDAVKLALAKWNQWRSENHWDPKIGTCVLASDAFFPFPDSLDLINGQSIDAVVQPGGSVQDSVVIDAANKHKIPMVFTGMRHFKH